MKVLIVDDQAPFRKAARTVVTVTPGFDVVGEASSGEEALEVAESIRPDLILMDINMPGIDGIETIRRLVAARPEAIAFLLSTYAVDDLPADARSCGARAYINKEDFSPAILDGLWRAGGDDAWRTA